MPEAATPALFRGVDRAVFATALSVRLRQAGIDVGLTSTQALTAALEVTRLDSVGHLYWAARITLVRRVGDLAAFDRVFAELFDTPMAWLGRQSRSKDQRPASAGDSYAAVHANPAVEEPGAGLPWATLPAVSGVSDATDSDVRIPDRLPSALMEIADLPFDEFDADQLALLADWLNTALRDWPMRRSRRQRVHAAGKAVALRSTMARARRTAWEPVELVRSRAIRRPRRLVLLCDVSQSMQAYTAAYLHLMRATALGADSEVFAFSTTLTRLTGALRVKSTDLAIEQATERVTDRFGGTRIAANVTAMLRSHRGAAVRGSIVVIASDGWDSDRPVLLEAAMRRLRRRAHAVIWLNPRAAAPGFEPLVGAMAAALPFCDEFLSAHSVNALGEVLPAIARAVSSHH